MINIELIYALLGALAVSSISLIGLILFVARIEKHKMFATAMVAFAAGALLGDVFFHMLPGQIEAVGYNTELIVALLAGITASLLIEAYIHCSHDVEDEHNHQNEGKEVLASMSLIGDAVHNFLDGVAIGASFLASPLTGISSTIAVIFHEIPQELADNAVLLHAGWSRKWVIGANFGTALTSLLGVLFVFAASSIVEGATNLLVPFAAGQFIYIALADFLPEIHRGKSNIRKYLLEISLFVLGLIVMWAFTLLE